MYSDELWSYLEKRDAVITKDEFRNLFRSCRVNSILKTPTTSYGYPINLYYLYYNNDNTISMISSSVYFFNESSFVGLS